MAWTAPRTYVTAEVITASILNTDLRDNLLETAPAKAGAGFVVATSTNLINVRDPQYLRINTSETTTSTSFTDLATAGPAVTTTTGVEVIIMWGAFAANSTTAESQMSIAVSGASTIAATTNYMFIVDGTERVGAMYSINLAVTAGSNTFTAKYKVGSASTGTWSNRFISVVPTR